MSDTNNDSAHRLARHSNPRLPVQAYAIGDRVQITSEAQSPTYVITTAELNQPERVWTYGVQKEGEEEVKWFAEGELGQQ